MNTGWKRKTDLQHYVSSVIFAICRLALTWRKKIVLFSPISLIDGRMIYGQLPTVERINVALMFNFL